jgi:hypothetical protein
MKERMMNANANPGVGDFSPLEFAELSSAILFVREVCLARGCASVMKFDQSLACIRAAG